MVHNQLHYTKQCLESIVKNTNYRPFELIVVDAHSTDGTLRYLRSKPEVKVISLKKNYTYAYSLNRGIEKAKGEYLCFMNNDLLFQKGWLKALIECAESDPRIGIVGPKLITNHRSETGRTVAPDGSHHLMSRSDKKVIPCTYVMGACFLCKKELINHIGLLDEKFFFAYEDTDYCLRAWKAGWTVVCCTNSKVIHLYGVTYKNVTKKDYEYNIHKYKNPEERFYRKYTSKDFKEILIKVKGGRIRYILWRIVYIGYRCIHFNSNPLFNGLPILKKLRLIGIMMKGEILPMYKSGNVVGRGSLLQILESKS